MNYQRTYINLVMAFVCILGGAWLPATQAREDSLPESRQAQTIPQGQVPTGLDREEWGQIVQQIQQSERPSAPNALTLQEIAKITASDGAPDDGFGYSVAVSGDTLVVGAFWKTMDGKFGQGAAYVFYRNQGGASQWGQVKKLTANDGAAEDGFGESVAVSRDTIAVGASTADIGDQIDQGAVYVFKRNQGGPDNWGQVRKLVGSDSSEGDNFGRSIAISEDTIVVGARRVDLEDTINQGEAYIFHRDQGGLDNWGELKKLTATDVDIVLLFGRSVSISGDTIVVGADTFVGGFNDQGAAYVFYRDQGGTDNWGQVARLTASDEYHDGFGYRVSISGATIVAGAPDAMVGENYYQGAAYIFYRDQGGADHWGEVKKLIASDGAANDDFGSEVFINDDAILVGADCCSDDPVPGKAYLFIRNQGGLDTWGEVTRLTASDGTAGDLFGRSISLSQNTLIIGAWEANVGENEDQGEAYIYYYPRFSPSLYLPLIMR